jgi:hypothetical protein
MRLASQGMPPVIVAADVNDGGVLLRVREVAKLCAPG